MEDKTNTRKQCYGCAYKGQVPGSAHSQCKFNFSKAGLKMPDGDEHGKRNGWYYFPYNYDPTWMNEVCEARSEKADPDFVKSENPVDNLISILASGRR